MADVNTEIKDLEEINLETGEAKPREAARRTEPEPQSRKRLWIILAVILVLLLAVGLVVGLAIEHDDDDEASGLDSQCLRDTGNLYLQSPELVEYSDNTDVSDWITCKQTGTKSNICDVVMPNDISVEFADLCEDAGGVPFTIDNARIRCTISVQNVGDVEMTMNAISLTECVATSCDVTDDKAFEHDAMVYFAKQAAADDEEVKTCQHID